ncbi:MAG: hypothetical protein IKX31_01735 [Muribaculaceae bacterium]|nr:hypothetical protein [Muribaculaceae bacterium]
MKKYFKYLSALALVAVAAMSLSSCSEKGLGETIFPDVTDELDPNSYTYNFDKWLKENYLDVYNLEFQYRLKDNETNMNYNLEPATLRNSIDLAVLAKYMWFDVYEEVTGSKEFLKMYGPRILMLVGSPAINPRSRTIEVGLAEGGIKVTLLNVNRLGNYVNNPQQLVNVLNDEYFHTMHHEFAHILHQTRSIPTEFRILSAGHYDGMNWEKKNSQMVHSLGFVTTYASSALREDFAETIACYITYSDAQWAAIMDEAARGWATDRDEESDSWIPYYCYYYYPNNTATDDNGESTLTYLDRNRVETLEDGTLVYRNMYQRGRLQNNKPTLGEDGNWYDLDGNLTDSQGYLLDKNGNRIPIYVYAVEDDDNVSGKDILETKIQLCKDWFRDEWGIDLEQLRNVVQARIQSFDAAKLEELRSQITLPE